MSHRLRFICVFGVSALMAVVVLLIQALSSQQASALTGGDFKAGRIVDDSIFFNSSSMSATDIQHFLNSKVPACNTWHAKSSSPNDSGPPYTCLKDYTQNISGRPADQYCTGSVGSGNKSAAQIIKDVSVACSINPRVLIVLLQKEQSLVTDTWPWGIQYQKATGYACPDTAPCDPEFAGFFNQTWYAARQFQRYAKLAGSYPYKAGVTNYIQYNPNTGCGGSSVYIQNQATAGLYNYTPYQPNQPALNNLYGTGDGCSAYGNRNFWRLFNDWFGPTTGKPSHLSTYAKSPCNIPPFNSSMVGRLYQPDVKNYLYTRNHAEACLAKSYGYIWDGVVFQNATGVDAVPIYRLANYERNVFTSDPNIRDDAINNHGYRDEGIGFYAYGSSGADRTPIYGAQLGDTFFITSSGKEAEYYRDNYDYHLYGTVFYTTKLVDNPQTIYRFVRNHQRIYTPHQSEINNALRYGFVAEGSVASNDTKPNTGNLPVYRTRTPAGIFLYTSDREERDRAVLKYDNSAEGMPFYSLMWSNKPVYRTSNPYNGFRIFTPSLSERTYAGQCCSYVADGIGWYSY